VIPRAAPVAGDGAAGMSPGNGVAPDGLTSPDGPAPGPDWDGAADFLRRYQSFLLCAHQKPDADTIGSSLGLANVLEGLGKRVTLVCADRLSASLATLPGADRFLTAVPAVPAIPAVSVGGTYEAIVALDASTLERLGAVPPASPALFGALPLLNIDHHLTNPRFGTVNLVDAQAAATAELVTLLAQRMSVPLSVPAATCLLAGLMTDTLSFQTESTTPRTLRVGASLLEAGAPLPALAFRFFRQRTRHSALVWSGALGTLRFGAGGRVAWVEVSRAVLEAAGPGADSGGLSGFAASIEGVEVGFSLEEAPDGTVFVGLRSATVDVAAVAARFGGGGHARAAGCQLVPPATLAAAGAALLTVIEGALPSLPVADSPEPPPA
jgi:bifunctional oligoribonuclease and PAP phosphatase NrnA